MHTPSVQEFRLAIAVLNKLARHLDQEAAERIRRLPGSHCGDQHATRIEAKMLEQTSRVSAVITQLERWRSQLQEPRRRGDSHPLE